MIAARVAGVPEAVLLHGVGQFFFVESLPRCLHRGKQCALGKSLGRARFLAHGGHVQHILRLSARQIRRQRLALLARLRFPRLRLLLLDLQIENLPPDLLDRRSRRVVPIGNAVPHDCRDDGRYRPNVIFVPCA